MDPNNPDNPGVQEEEKSDGAQPEGDEEPTEGAEAADDEPTQGPSGHDEGEGSPEGDPGNHPPANESERVANLQSQLHKAENAAQAAQTAYEEAQRELEKANAGPDVPEDAEWAKEEYRPETYKEVIEIAEKRAREGIEAKATAEAKAKDAAAALLEAQYDVIKTQAKKDGLSVPTLDDLVDLGLEYKLQDLKAAYKIHSRINSTKTAAERKAAEAAAKRAGDGVATGGAVPSGGGGPSYDQIHSAGSALDLVHQNVLNN